MRTDLQHMEVVFSVQQCVQFCSPARQVLELLLQQRDQAVSSPLGRRLLLLDALYQLGLALLYGAQHCTEHLPDAHYVHPGVHLENSSEHNNGLDSSDDDCCCCHSMLTTKMGKRNT